MVRQLQATDGFELLDLLQAYVGSLVLRKSSKRNAYAVVRSFFAHNRCALPQELIAAEIPKVPKELQEEHRLKTFIAVEVFKARQEIFQENLAERRSDFNYVMEQAAEVDLSGAHRRREV